jgi:hypothetical protein
MRVVCGAVLGTVLLVGAAWGADEFEEAPIAYSKSTPKNAVSALSARIERGETKLQYDEQFGYLKALLTELDVPTESQQLVFSKTSLQRQRIAPRTPRALYFNDDVYVGYCHEGEVLEVSVADPQLGTVFYSLDQQQRDKPTLVRQSDNCLICHAGSQTQSVPGHIVRSVYADGAGQPNLASGTYRIDHSSPFEQRWGGWYVTGTHGAMKHLGNMITTSRREAEQRIDDANMNVADLGDRIERNAYLTPHSDIVALLVMEHQTMAHNAIVRANFTARQAKHYQDALNRELKMPDDNVWDSTKSRIKSAGEPLVKCLLFSEEASLTDPVRGTSGFAESFVARGAKATTGRSLRDFDLEKRLFKHPCSYVIYTESFDALPPVMLDYVWQRLHEVLTGKDQSPAFAQLSVADRQAILEILRATKTNLPKYFAEGAEKK